jgi:hypothetical protein
MSQRGAAASLIKEEGEQVKLAAYLLSFLLVTATSAFGEPYPHVPLVFGYLPFDQSCEQWRNTTIERQWYAELRTKITMFQDYWEQEAPVLLGTTIAAIHKPFRYQEMIATLTLCPIPSMSRPLLINLRPFLDGPTQQQPRPLLLFSAVMFHELLHTYVIGVLPPGKSVLLEKYQSEEPVVKNHLHLLAIMKLVYLKLDRAEQLQQIIEKDRALGSLAYGRAWQIVNDLEGHEAFVHELMQ